MQIIPLSIPTPFYVGDVNVYLIKNDPVTLIDVGPQTPEAADALRSKLAANGMALRDGTGLGKWIVEGFAHAGPYAWLLLVRARGKPYIDLRRLRFETYHAQSDRFARPRRSGKTLSVARRILGQFGKASQLQTDTRI